MLLGPEQTESLFKRLIKNESLSHGYIFFGEPNVGKYSFALCLASFLENGEFEEVRTDDGVPNQLLEETLIVRPKDGSIGIDEIRSAKYFLSQRPVNSSVRLVIIDDADLMTTQAQQATLKIAEEPPEKSLIVLIVHNSGAIINTLQSRFQKIHFRRSKKEEISKMLQTKLSLTKNNADELAVISLGRPGRAVSLAVDAEAKERIRVATSLISKRTTKKKIIESLLETPENTYPILTEIIAKLAENPVKNYDTLMDITKRMAQMSMYSTNRRIQLESALWNI